MKHCTLERVLDEEQTKFVKHLYNLLKREGPEGSLLCTTKGDGEGDHLNKKYGPCSHYHSFGYEKYCDDQCLIKEHILDNKDKYPDLYQKISGLGK